MFAGGDNGGSYITYTIINPQEWKYLKFSGRMRTEDVVKGDKPWSRARLLLYFKDAQNRSLWEHPHVLCSLYGDNKWRKHTRIFPVPENAVTAHAVAQNAGYSGYAWFDELSVVGATREKSFLWINMTAGLIWVTVLILLMHMTGIWVLPYNRVIMGLIVLIVIGVAMPQPVINTLAEKSKGLSISAIKETDQKPSSKSVNTVIENNKSDPFAGYESESLIGIIKGIGHFTLFALISLFLNMAYKEKNKTKREIRKTIGIVPVISIILGLSFFAGATEVLQFVSETRGRQFMTGLLMWQGFLLERLGM